MGQRMLRSSSSGTKKKKAETPSAVSGRVALGDTTNRSTRMSSARKLLMALPASGRRLNFPKAPSAEPREGCLQRAGGAAQRQCVYSRCIPEEKPSEDKSGVYDFEVDENEPVQVRQKKPKRKKTSVSDNDDDDSWHLASGSKQLQVSPMRKKLRSRRCLELPPNVSLRPSLGERSMVREPPGDQSGRSIPSPVCEDTDGSTPTFPSPALRCISVKGKSTLPEEKKPLHDLSVDNCFGFSDDGEEDISPVLPLSSSGPVCVTPMVFAATSTPQYHWDMATPVPTCDFLGCKPSPMFSSSRRQNLLWTATPKLRVSEERTIKQRVPEEGTIERRVPEEGTIEQRVPEEGTTKQSNLKDVSTRQGVPEEGTTKQSNLKDGSTRQRVPEEGTTKQDDPEDTPTRPVEKTITVYSPVPVLVQTKLQFMVPANEPPVLTQQESPCLFKDMEELATAFTKPPRRSYERSRRKLDRPFEPEERWSEDEEETKLEEMQRKAKRTKQSKEEKRQADKWAADFRRCCSEVEEYELCVE